MISRGLITTLYVLHQDCYVNTTTAGEQIEQGLQDKEDAIVFY